MPRRIRSLSFQATGAPVQLDGYFDRVSKYVPADIVAAWVAVSQIVTEVGKNDPNAGRVLWIAFAVGIVLTATWTWRQTHAPPAPPAWVQIIVSTVAFIVWVFALGGPFATLDWYQVYYGSLLLIAFTLVSGLVSP